MEDPHPKLLLLLDIEFPVATNFLDRSEAHPLLRVKRIDCDVAKAGNGGFVVVLEVVA